MPVTLLSASLHTVGSRDNSLLPHPLPIYWVNKSLPNPQTKARQEAKGGDLILDSHQLLNFFSLSFPERQGRSVPGLQERPAAPKSDGSIFSSPSTESSHLPSLRAIQPTLQQLGVCGLSAFPFP